MHQMLELLWGHKSVAIFDIWFIEHVMFGISIGSAVRRKNHTILQKLLGRNHSYHSWYFAIVGVLFWAYLWEDIEHYLEMGLAGEWLEYWLNGVEFWANRLFADPLMLVMGYLIAKRFPILVWPARMFSFLWVLIHLFVFPHSMYLHTL
jgi:hypothetical protein